MFGNNRTRHQLTDRSPLSSTPAYVLISGEDSLCSSPLSSPPMTKRDQTFIVNYITWHGIA